MHRLRVVNPFIETGVSKPSDMLNGQEILQALNHIQSLIPNCIRCPLARFRDPDSRYCLYSGSFSSGIMLIGKAPGYWETKKGGLFVGKAGDELRWFLKEAEIPRVYITNACQCRAPNDRDLKSKEISGCRAYLEMQIELVRPKVIVLMGSAAIQAILGRKSPVNEYRGQRLKYRDIATTATYHPALFTRSTIEVEERNRLEGLKDWKLVKEMYGNENSAKTTDG